MSDIQLDVELLKKDVKEIVEFEDEEGLEAIIEGILEKNNVALES